MAVKSFVGNSIFILEYTIMCVCICRKHLRAFPYSCIITGFVIRLTRWVPLMEQELPTLPEHLSSLTDFSGVRVARSLVLCVCFVDRLLPFVLFVLAIVLSVLFRYTDSDYLFGISKLFFPDLYLRIYLNFFQFMKK